MRDRNGFTLVELLVVLSIMALLLILISPYIGPAFPQMELKSAAREVAAALREARSRAITHNTETIFNLDVQKRAYIISGDGTVHGLPPNLGLLLYTARGEALGTTSGDIRFFPDGSSTGGHVLLSESGRSYRVTVNWLTGHVEID